MRSSRRAFIEAMVEYQGDRPITLRTTNGSVLVRFDYDGARLVRETDARGTVTTSYDPGGRVARVIERSGDRVWTTQFTYGDRDRTIGLVQTESDDTHHTTAYRYDGQGRLAHVDYDADTREDLTYCP